MALRKIYKVLICGGTEWSNASAIRRVIKKLIAIHGKENLVIIEGKAPGADTMAGIIGTSLDVHVVEVGALWNTRHRGAGPQRNDIMLALEPHEVIGFHENISKSRGTRNTIDKARKLGIKNKVVKK